MAVKEQELPGKSKAKAPLREGWRIVRFGDVARHVKVDADPETSGLERYVAGEHMNTDDLHIRSWGIIGDGYLGPAFHRKFVKGQVLYGSRRTYLRKVAVAEFDGICANTTFVIEPNGDELLPELLPFIMQTESFSAHAVKQSRGSVNPYVNWKDIAWYEFALPPKNEQQRIADILWAADSAFCSWQDAHRNARKLKQQWLKDIFDDRKIFDKQRSGGWRVSQLSSCAEVRTGVAKGKDYGTQKTVVLPYLRVANLQEGYLDLTEVKHIEIAVKEISRYSLRVGDVLLTEGGDFDKVGRGTVWRGEIEGCLHQNHIFCVRPNIEILAPEFLSYQTNSAYGKQYFLSCSKQTTNLASINASQVKAFPVLLPSLEEQRRIVDVLSSIEKRVCAAETHLLKLNQLRRALCSTLLERVSRTNVQ